MTDQGILLSSELLTLSTGKDSTRMSISRRPVRLYYNWARAWLNRFPPLRLMKGATDERSTASGGYQERRLHSDIRRQAEKMGYPGPAFRRMGDLSHERLAQRSEPHLRLANKRLVRADHPTLRRRR